jgi:hypothetical protein
VDDAEPDADTANPVHEQRRVIARKVAGGGAAAAIAEEADWEEF